jgi:hypothetical protein
MPFNKSIKLRELPLQTIKISKDASENYDYWTNQVNFNFLKQGFVFLHMYAWEKFRSRYFNSDCNCWKFSVPTDINLALGGRGKQRSL